MAWYFIKHRGNFIFAIFKLEWLNPETSKGCTLLVNIFAPQTFVIRTDCQCSEIINFWATRCELRLESFFPFQTLKLRYLNAEAM